MSDLVRCNWENCLFEGPRKEGIFHVILEHINDPKLIPFYCTKCHYKAQCMNSLKRHVRTYGKHKKIHDPKETPEKYLIVSKTPYNVTWSSDPNDFTDLCILGEEINYLALPVEEVIEEIVVEVAEKEVQTEDNLKQIKEELEEERRKRREDQQKFGDYVMRLEKKIKIRDELISTLRKEIRSKEPMVEGFEEMWRRCTEEDEERPRKKMKSVVRKLF